MPHRKKKQSTGSAAGNRDQHQGLQKQKKEIKKQNPDWRPKNETEVQRKERLKRSTR
jgi:hypothetical protein